MHNLLLPACRKASAVLVLVLFSACAEQDDRVVAPETDAFDQLAEYEEMVASLASSSPAQRMETVQLLLEKGPEIEAALSASEFQKAGGGLECGNLNNSCQGMFQFWEGNPDGPVTECELLRALLLVIDMSRFLNNGNASFAYNGTFHGFATTQPYAQPNLTDERTYEWTVSYVEDPGWDFITDPSVLVSELTQAIGNWLAGSTDLPVILTSRRETSLSKDPNGSPRYDGHYMWYVDQQYRAKEFYRKTCYVPDLHFQE